MRGRQKCLLLMPGKAILSNLGFTPRAKQSLKNLKAEA